MFRIVLADDQKSFIDALKYTLEKSGEVQVVGCAYNGLEAYELSKQQKPDIVLMDLLMPVCDGIEGTELIKAHDNKIKVLVLTTFNDDNDISRALQKGADGYILKEIDTVDILMAIKSVMSGLGIVHDKVLKKVSQMLTTPDAQESIPSVKELELSIKEIDVIKFVVDGLSNREIAQKLNYTEGTVKNVLTGILTKTNTKDRTQLAVFALKNRIM